MQIEPLTEKTVTMLRRSLGMGAMIFDWDIDLAAGAGILDSNTKCIWTKRGIRTTFVLKHCPGEGPLYMTTQGKDTDPEYPNRKGEKL
jgi:hypothetical protein